MTGKQCRLGTRRLPMLWCKADGASIARWFGQNNAILSQSKRMMLVPLFYIFFQFFSKRDVICVSVVSFLLRAAASLFCEWDERSRKYNSLLCLLLLLSTWTWLVAEPELGSLADRPHFVQSPSAAVPSWLALGMKPAQHAAADVRNWNSHSFRRGIVCLYGLTLL